MPLIYFWIVEDHHPERVFRQFGMKQVPPDIVDTFLHLHKISLQGKLDKDWVQEHAVYIDRWAHREEHIADTLHWIGTRCTLLLTWSRTKGRPDDTLHATRHIGKSW